MCFKNIQHCTYALYWKKKNTKKALSDCNKKWWVPRTHIEKQTIKISKRLNDLLPHLVITQRGSK